MQEQERFTQISECMADICEKQNPSTLPFFQQGAAAMVHQLEAEGIKCFPRIQY